jgi:hypothetical protein
MDDDDLQHLEFSANYPVSYALATEMTAQYESFRAGMLHPHLQREIANLEMLNNMMHRTVRAVRDLEIRLDALET